MIAPLRLLASRLRRQSATADPTAGRHPESRVTDVPPTIASAVGGAT